MIAQVSPADRISLVTSTQLAMGGLFSEAREAFRTASDKALSEHRIIDYVWLRMGWAEALYIDCREEEAQAVFRGEIDPLLSDIPTSLRVVVDQNRTTVGMASWDLESIRHFYQILDMQRFLGTDSSDKRALLFGEDASRSARYFDSVPTFWRAVLETHASGHWQSLYSAYKRLGIECTKAGLARHAIHCAIRSMDASLVPDASELLCASKDSGVIADALSTAVGFSNLLRHAGVTVALVCRLADFVPEEKFTSLLDWALSKAMLVPANRTSAGVIEETWKCLAKAAWRFDSAQAKCVVEGVLGHPFASTESRYRRTAIALLQACLSSVAAEELRLIADWGVEILRSAHPTEIDDASHLLAAVAMRADASMKSGLAKQLGFSDLGKTTADRERIASALGFRPGDEDLRRIAADAARQIGLQVQKGAPGFTPDTSLSFSLQAGFTSDSEAVAVFISGGARAFDSVVAHAKHLEKPSVELLFGVALALVNNPDNAIANKLFLIEDITELVPFLTEAEGDQLLCALEQIASRPIEESCYVAANTNPLSPFQANLGAPADLQARAVLAISKLAGRFFDRFGTRGLQIISKSLADSSSVVRAGAVASIDPLAVVPEELLFGLLAATRDPDQTVREAAYSILASREELKLNATHQRFLLLSIRQALDTPTPRVRWMAARALNGPVLKDPSEDLRNVVEDARRCIAADVSRSVRSLAANPGASVQSPPVGSV